MTKPRVAFFDFTCCEGCQLTVLNCEDEILDILGAVDIVNFREAMTNRSDDYDIAFVEGSCTHPSEIPRLEKIRQNAKVVVALGACAATGGINCLKNFQSMDDVLTEVYGKDAGFYSTIPARPVDAVIKVDHKLHGCPIRKDEFIRLVTDLLQGKKPYVVNSPVCAECKMAGNVCVFEKGKTCLGPITRGGCQAVCVTGGSLCWGCRGLVDEPNVDSEKEVLAKYGVSMDDIIRKFRLYYGSYEVAKSA